MGDSINKPLISLIVPVYKVEKYLQRCIDSILRQTYENLEIILVDDGSPDDCPRICDDNAERDSRIRVIHKQNGGLSDARNAGLEVFQGEYLMFIDSDDVLPVNSVDTLYTLAKKYDAQLVIGAHTRIYNDEIPQEKFPLMQSMEQVWNSTQAIKDVFQNGCAAWARLYRKEIHAHIRFPVNEINEDEAIALQIIYRCENIVKTEQTVYYYTCRPESITTSSFSKKKLDWPIHCQSNLEWIQKYMPELESEALYRFLSSLLWAMREMALSDKILKDEERFVKSKLLEYFVQFKKLPLKKSERVRMYLIRWLPFKVYQMLESKH